MISRSLLMVLTGFAAPVLSQPAPEPPVSEANMVSDFIDDIPQLDEVTFEMDGRVLRNPPPRHLEQFIYHYRHDDVVAHSFIRDRNSKEKRGERLGEAAIAGFTQECTDKGGYLEPANQRPFDATLSHLFDGAYFSLWYKRIYSGDPVLDLVICSASPNRSLGALTVTRDVVTNQTAIVLLAPSAVVTQADLDEKRAAMEAQGRREAAIRQQEADRLAPWRQSIAEGTETVCGPVLRTNGDLVEVVDPGTRQPRWYRRGELLPAILLDGRPNVCR